MEPEAAVGRLTRMRRAVLLLTIPLALLACANDRSTPEDTTAGTTPSPTSSETMATTEITITVNAGVGIDPVTYTLTCEPPGGDHPDPAAACASLEEAAAAPLNPLSPVRTDMACTEIYGGDQTAVIEGVVQGTPVRAELSRVNGCEIARWDALVPVLVVPGGV